MRILAVSDIHEKAGRLSKLYAKLVNEGLVPDIVVVAGDITYFKDLGTALRILRMLRDTFNAKVLFVPGNCDPRDLLNVREVEQDIVNIHANPLQIGDHIFYGVGGSGLTPHRTWIEYSEDEFRLSLQLVENLVSGGRGSPESLVVVTHQPIHGFFDEIRGERVGSKAFYEFLVRFQPLLWVTGHMHEYSGWVRHGRTTIVHPGPLMHNRYALVEVEGTVVKRVDIGRIEGV